MRMLDTLHDLAEIDEVIQSVRPFVPSVATLVLCVNRVNCRSVHRCPSLCTLGCRRRRSSVIPQRITPLSTSLREGYLSHADAIYASSMSHTHADSSQVQPRHKRRHASGNDNTRTIPTGGGGGSGSGRAYDANCDEEFSRLLLEARLID